MAFDHFLEGLDTLGRVGLGDRPPAELDESRVQKKIHDRAEVSALFFADDVLKEDGVKIFRRHVWWGKRIYSHTL